MKSAHITRIRQTNVGLTVLLSTLWVSAAMATPWSGVDEIETLLDGVEPERAGIELEMPSVTQDGSAVPVSITVRAPVKGDDAVEAIYLFALGNPSPELAEFYLSPRIGEATVDTRVRLNESQTVVALAKLANDRWLVESQEVRVTVSGCLSRDGADDEENFMQTRARVTGSAAGGTPGEVRALIQHPMETGLRKDRSGALIPERIIREFRVDLDGEEVMKVRLHRAISANPYFRFGLAPGLSGSLTLLWEEDTGETASVTEELT